MSFSDYAEAKILDHITGKASFTMPTAYVALFVGNPLDTGAGGAEVSGSNYSRVATSASDWASAASGATSNAVAITFPIASGSWGTVDYFALYDASTAGNILAAGALTSGEAVGSGDVPSFAIGDLDITLD